MSKVLNIRNLLLAICCFSWFAAISQVDESKPRQDTLYIIEEEITYDTLYLQGSQLDELLTKEELMEAFQNRGIGQIYYNKGRFWLTGNEEVYKLDKADLQMLFSPAQYEDHRKSKRNQYISIPLFVAGGGAAAIAGIGLVQFCASFIQTAKYHEQLLDSDNLGLNIWRSAMGGVFLVGGGMLVAAGCLHACGCGLPCTRHHTYRQEQSASQQHRKRF